MTFITNPSKVYCLRFKVLSLIVRCIIWILSLDTYWGTVYKAVDDLQRQGRRAL